MIPSDVVLPKGSLILVTGASGFLGSVITDQFLHYGCNVRGTTRDPAKSVSATNYFSKKYGDGRFEFVSVTNLDAAGAYDEAIKGTAAVIHVASNMSLNPDPNNVIRPSIKGVINLLKTAYSESRVKRFVLTSSSSAAILAVPGVETNGVLDADTWNETAVKAAWADPPYTAERAAYVYAANKTQTEQAVWKFYKDHKDDRPDIIVNTVLPNMLFGSPVAQEGYPSSSTLVPDLWNGSVTPYHTLLPPQYCIDVGDAARLHVAGAILENVKDERIFGFAHKYSWDLILDIFRKMAPEEKFVDNFSGGTDQSEVVLRDRAEEILKMMGRPGWVSLEDIIKNNLQKF